MKEGLRLQFSADIYFGDNLASFPSNFTKCNINNVSKTHMYEYIMCKSIPTATKIQLNIYVLVNLDLQLAV